MKIRTLTAVSIIVAAMSTSAHETYDLNSDGKNDVGDLLILEQALMTPSPPPLEGPINFIVGTGNDTFEPTTATFAQEWNIIVTGSGGQAVVDTMITVSLRSVYFYKGFLVPGATQWFHAPGSPIQCLDEDTNFNGILESAEDINGSGQIEAGNVAIVAPATAPCTAAGAGGTTIEVPTNGQGIASVCVIWPQNFSWWVDTQIKASLIASGSEWSHARLFILPALAEDIANVNRAPPNVFSPFGPDFDCMIPPPGLPLP